MKIVQEKALAEQRRTTAAAQTGAAAAQMIPNVPLITHAAQPLSTHNNATVLIRHQNMTPAELNAYHHSTISSGIIANNDPIGNIPSISPPQSRFSFTTPYATNKKEFIDKFSGIRFKKIINFIRF